MTGVSVESGLMYRDRRVGDIARSRKAYASTGLVDAIDPEVLPDGMSYGLCSERGEDEGLHGCKWVVLEW
jgi:hypothetical protein